MIYIITYGCGCGQNTEAIEAKDLDTAQEYAYESAKEDYESYAGYHGIQDIYEVCEDQGIEDTNSDEAWTAYTEVVESAISYEARLANLDDEDDQEIIKDGVYNV